MAPIFIFCNLLFFLSFVPDILNYLVGISINFVKFLFNLHEHAQSCVHIVEELGGGSGTRIGQALIFINVLFLLQRTQKPESV